MLKHLSMTGRSRVVLVSHAATEPIAVVTTLVARVTRQEHGPRLAVAGPVHFADDTLQHLHNIVLPAVDQVTSALGIGEQHFELSVVNLAAASIHELAMEVEGHSIDTAAALAMLSAALQLPVRQDVVTTGHIVSVVGDIRPVRSLHEKLQAACATPAIREFLCPSLNEDRSLDALAPDLLQETVDAIVAAAGRIRVTQIRDLAELLRAATTEKGRLLGALSAGYFHCRKEDLSGAAAALVAGLEDMFWRRLELQLNRNRSSGARRLLRLRIAAELKRGRYPTGFGSRLMALVRSVPPVIRRRRRFFPLLSPKAGFALGCLARAADQDDASRLLCAAIGHLGDGPLPGRNPVEGRPAPAPQSLEAILDAINLERLAREIGIPADEARAGFTLPGVIIEDYDLFHETITAFHLALIRHTDGSNPPAQPDEALGLLERTFADAGGLPAARAEAKFALDGGMRRILDLMTEQHKSEQRFKRVNRVLKQWLDPLDWDRQLELMRALLERLRRHLPDELKDADPARFVRRREEIVRAYVQGADRIGSLIRTM